MKPRLLYRYGTSCMIVASAVNVVVACFAFVRLRKPIDLHVVYKTYSLPAATNFVSSSSAPFLSSLRVSESKLDTPTTLARPANYSLPYRYFISSGKPYARLGILDYTVGDRHAYGTIRDIYPERIFFQDGSYIDNTLTGVRNVPDSPGAASNNS